MMEQDDKIKATSQITFSISVSEVEDAIVSYPEG